MGVGLWPEMETALVPAAEFDAVGVRQIRALVEYQTDPIGFLRDVLAIPEHTIRWSLNVGYGAHVWDGTRDPLAAILEALVRWENVGVESATGTGKSFLGAGIVLWFLGVWEGARVFSFAPKEDQLRLYIWAEINKLWPAFQRRFPTAELSDLRIRMDGTDNWAAFGYSVAVGADEQVATNAQGMHAEHMLLIYEETPGIHPAVMAAGQNTCTAPHNIRLAFGNPDNQLDTLHQFCTKPTVRHVRISALDHPNVVTGNPSLIPGAASPKSIADRREDYGDDSPLYGSRVRGLSPAEASNSLIRLEWIDRAVSRWREWRKQPDREVGRWALGVDVANSENGDKAAIARWTGATLDEVVAFPCPNANRLGADVHVEMRALRILPEHVGVDTIGVGAGTVNELLRLTDNVGVQALNSGASAVKASMKLDDGTDYEWGVDFNLFHNLRSQMWWQMREDLRLDRLALPDDAQLVRELTTPTWKSHNGKVVVEDKAQIKKRLGNSPDKADAAVYGNWVRPRQSPPQPQRLMQDAYAHGQDASPLIPHVHQDPDRPGWGLPPGY